MKFVIHLLVWFSISCFQFTALAQTPKLLLRLDDNGMNHSVNIAIKK